MDKTYVFSAPGRTEIGGNHTDHQRGCVLAAAVNLETLAKVTLNSSDMIRVQSEGYPAVTVNLKDLTPRDSEKNTSAALVRGIAAAFVRRGARIQGFECTTRSSVLPGSGLSSSAAFEVLMGTILNELFLGGKLSPIEIAQIGQYAENFYFGKPCGLMDQMASSVGGMVFIDFEDPDAPKVERIDFDLEKAGYALCIIDSGANHADLTGEYAAIPAEMKQVAAYFSKDVLRKVPEDEFYAALPELRRRMSDRAVLRAMHFFDENKRVQLQVKALKNNDVKSFLKLVNDSGRSSWMFLQNITPTGAVEDQEMAIALALCKRLLAGKGAYRVHGGGFAGTVQAFVPLTMLDDFRFGVEKVLGRGKCHVLNIRSQGGAWVK